MNETSSQVKSVIHWLARQTPPTAEEQAQAFSHLTPLDTYKAVFRVREFGIDIMAIGGVCVVFIVAFVALIGTGHPVITLILSMPLAALAATFGYLGWQIATLKLTSADRAELALRRLQQVTSALRAPGEWGPNKYLFKWASLIQNLPEDSIDNENQLEALLKALPDGAAADIALAQFKTTDQYRRIRLKRTVYGVFALLVVGLAAYYVFTHWTS